MDLTATHKTLGETGFPLAPYLSLLGEVSGAMDLMGKALFENEARYDVLRAPIADFFSGFGSYLDLVAAKFRFSDHGDIRSDGLVIDTGRSGLPTYPTLVRLQRDALQNEERLQDMRSESDMRASMLRSILQDQVYPGVQQYGLAQRTYRQKMQSAVGLGKAEYFERNGPLFLCERGPVGDGDSEVQRDAFSIAWSQVCQVSGLPSLFFLDFEVDEARTFVHRHEEHEELRDFLRRMSSRDKDTHVLATEIDLHFKHVHPKYVERLNVGPLVHRTYAPNLGSDIPRGLFESFGEDDWIMRLDSQSTVAMGEKYKRGILRSSIRQVFDGKPLSSERFLMTGNVFLTMQELYKTQFRGAPKYVLDGSGSSLRMHN